MKKREALKVGPCDIKVAAIIVAAFLDDGWLGDLGVKTDVALKFVSVLRRTTCRYNTYTTCYALIKMIFLIRLFV
jgi:hypothetical protein